MEVFIDIDHYFRDGALEIEVSVRTEGEYYPTSRITRIDLDVLAERLLPYIRDSLQRSE